MQKIIFIKDYKGFKIGDITLVGNNETHFLIDNEIAELYDYQDKMMRSKRRRK